MSFATVLFAWLHIFFAVGWIRGALLSALILTPVLRGMSPQAAAEFTAKFMPKMGKMMGVFSSLTVVFGAALLYFYDRGTPFGCGRGLWVG